MVYIRTIPASDFIGASVGNGKIIPRTHAVQMSDSTRRKFPPTRMSSMFSRL